MPVRTRHKLAPASAHELEANRESMLALAEFLRTRPPPPGNLMSQSDSEGDAVQSNSLLGKVVRRKKSRARKQVPRLMQLPDTAVAATTKDGHRHIAISIPELAESGSNKPLPAVPIDVEPTQNKTRKQQRGPVVVLKPVREARALNSAVMAAEGQTFISSKPSGPVRPRSLVKTGSNASLEAVAPPRRVHKRATGGSDLSSQLTQELTEDQLIRVDDDEMHTDGYGRRYSDPALDTRKAADSARSSNINNLDASTKLGAELQSEIKAATAKLNAYDQYQEAQSIDGRTSTPEILCRELFDAPNSAITFEEFGHEHNTIPNGPPPRRDLPEIPNGSTADICRAIARACSLSSRPSSTTLEPQFAAEMKAELKFLAPTNPQVEQARTSQQSGCPISPATSAVAQRQSWSRPYTANALHSRISISNLMVVADLPPREAPRASVATHSQHLLQRKVSVAPSLASIPFSYSTKDGLDHDTPIDSGFPSSSTCSVRSRVQRQAKERNDMDALSVQRQARKQARNASIKQQAVEQRLRRLESDNKLLLEALSNIVGGFGVLKRAGLLDTQSAMSNARVEGPASARKRIEGWSLEVGEKSRW